MNSDNSFFIVNIASAIEPSLWESYLVMCFIDIILEVYNFIAHQTLSLPSIYTQKGKSLFWLLLLRLSEYQFVFRG